MTPSESNVRDRLPTLDIFRGIAVLSLIVFNGFYGFTNAPGWLTHAKWGGYTFADLIAPLFLFAVGMAMQLSLRKRFERDGLKATAKHVMFRGFLLISFGTIGDFLCFWDLDLHWGTLEMIGGATMISAPLIICLSPWKRIYAGLWIILGWFFLNALSNPLHSHIAKFTMGGPGAVIAWSSIAIIGSAISEFLTDPKTSRSYTKAILTVFLGSGLIFLLFNMIGVLPNKNLVNSPYLALSVCLCCALLVMSSAFSNFSVLRSALVPYGKNALAMYMISGSMNQLLQLSFSPDISLNQLLPYSLLLILTASGIIFRLNSKNIVLKI